jgi:hypothetical protein
MMRLPTLALPPDVSLRSQDIEWDQARPQPVEVPDDELHEVPMAMTRENLSLHLIHRAKAGAR